LNIFFLFKSFYRQVSRVIK